MIFFGDVIRAAKRDTPGLIDNLRYDARHDRVADKVFSYLKKYCLKGDRREQDNYFVCIAPYKGPGGLLVYTTRGKYAFRPSTTAKATRGNAIQRLRDLLVFKWKLPIIAPTIKLIDMDRSK